MTERQAIEDLLEELYAARVRGDLDAVVNLFAANATFQVAGTDETSPMPTSGT
jgi:ketosteroid isomerase-like protein